MATRHTGRCGVASCAWRFSSSSLALIAELYGNHYKKAHTGSAALLVEPGWLLIPWPPDSQQLMQLNLAGSPERGRARVVRQLLFGAVGSTCAAAGMLITALFMTANPAYAAGIAGLGGGSFWIGFFLPELLLSSGVLLCSLRVSRSTVSSSFRRFGLVLFIVALAASVIMGGLLWLGLIGIADIATSGEVPTSFSDLYLLQILLAGLSTVGLLASAMAFRSAARTHPTSIAAAAS